MSHHHPVIQPLEPRLFLSANGIDPYNLGKGDWIWYLSSARSNLKVANNLQLFQNLKSKGMKWVIVKASQTTDPNFASGQFNEQLVADAHAAGLKLFAYQYVTGANPAGEAAAAKTVIARGADGFIIDAEGEYERLANNAAAATTYMTTIRAAYPDLFIAHAPFPIVSYHRPFPYYEFGKYSDAVMPQDYWGMIDVSPAEMVTWQNNEWNTLYNGWRGTSKADAIKPIVPIAQGWNDSTTPRLTTGADIVQFVNLLKTVSNPASPNGYRGVSFWSVQHHNTDQWSGVAAATIGLPVFAVGQTVRVGGTGTSGLKAWSDSSSVAPATYVVKPEGAVATVVSGPVFAEGYNRWRVRYKGDTVDRWSAEDFLDPAPVPAAPQYVSPGNNSYYANTPPAKLDWNDVDVATSYDVYLDGVLKAGNLTASEYALAGVTLGTHTWFVRAKNSAGGTAGATWSFTTLASPAKPSGPKPGNGASVAISPAKLDWVDAASATSYDVFLNNVLLGTVATSEWTMATPPASKAVQTWRVVAKNAASSTAGDDWTFRVDPIAGDANADGVVNDTDFQILRAGLYQSGGWSQGDFNADGWVNFTDYQVLERNFGNTAPVAAEPVVAEVLKEPAVPTKRPPFSLKPIAKPRPVTVSRRTV